MTVASAVITDKDWISLPILFLADLMRGPWANERYERRRRGWHIVSGDVATPMTDWESGCCEKVLARLGTDAIRVEGDAPHHGYVNTDAAHMPEGVAGRLEWDARLRQRGERDES